MGPFFFLIVHDSSGNGGHLSISIVRSESRAVCYPGPYPPEPTVYESCQAIVDQMNASERDTLFAQQGIHSPVEIPLPILWAAPAQSKSQIHFFQQI